MLIDFRQLFPKYKIKPKGVLHIGANVGEEAPIYKELGIDNAIFIEADFQVYKKLIDNIIKIDGVNYMPINALIGDENKQVTFHISNNGGQSSSIYEFGTHKIAHLEVEFIKDVTLEMHRIDSIFDQLNDYDFLNIDVQGAELLVLKGMGDLLNGFNWVYLEINVKELYKGCALLPEVTAYLMQF